VTLVRVMSYPGLALGTGLAALFNAGMLFWLLRRRLDGLDDARVMMAFGKILAASAVMAAAAWGTEHYLSVAWPATHAIARLVRVGLAVSAGLATLALVARLLRLHEFESAFGRVMARLVRR
jgi:putative peptidoglycan lipid II flippase